MPSFPVPTVDVVSRVFIVFIALKQVITIHSGMVADREDLVSRQAKPVKVPQDWANSGQSIPQLFKALVFLSHGSIFINVCRNNALLRSKGFPVDTSRLPDWRFGRLSLCPGAQHDLRLTIRPQSSHMRSSSLICLVIYHSPSQTSTDLGCRIDILPRDETGLISEQDKCKLQFQIHWG
ncbi:hypothetical protein TNCV_121451 [Trichonephila clavipes]|nr:hypothetical protein TNCV_121451 [Trichonephila clavipes]